MYELNIQASLLMCTGICMKDKVYSSLFKNFQRFTKSGLPTF